MSSIKYEETFFFTRPMVASRGTLCVWAPKELVPGQSEPHWHGMPTLVCSWWIHDTVPILVAIAHHSLQ